MQRAQGFGPMSRGRKSPCPTTSDYAIDSALLDYVLHCPCDLIFRLARLLLLEAQQGCQGRCLGPAGAIGGVSAEGAAGGKAPGQPAPAAYSRVDQVTHPPEAEPVEVHR